MKYQAVIFDVDGLMVDTERMCFELWKEEGKKMGHEITEEFYRLLIGGSANIIDMIEDEYPFARELADHMRGRRDTYFYEYFKEPGSCNKPGLETLYRYLKANGYRIAVASSSHRSYVDQVLHYLGFPFEVDAVIGGDEVTVPKPNPDVFLRAQEKLGIAKENCLILEDSRNGIIAAHAAGIDVVFIEDMVPPDELMHAYMLKQVPTLAEVIQILQTATK